MDVHGKYVVYQLYSFIEVNIYYVHTSLFKYG
jgi:hypothetical protein